MTMHKIELSAGTIEYKDSGGEGPVIVLLHGFLMDASLWDGVIADLPKTTATWFRPCRLAGIGAL